MRIKFRLFLDVSANFRIIRHHQMPSPMKFHVPHLWIVRIFVFVRVGKRLDAVSFDVCSWFISAKLKWGNFHIIHPLENGFLWGWMWAEENVPIIFLLFDFVTMSLHENDEKVHGLFWQNNLHYFQRYKKNFLWREKSLRYDSTTLFDDDWGNYFLLIFNDFKKNYWEENVSHLRAFIIAWWLREQPKFLDLIFDLFIALNHQTFYFVYKQ